MSVKLKRVYNVDTIKNIIFHPVLAEVAVPDNIIPENFPVDLDNSAWFTILVDYKEAGIFWANLAAPEFSYVHISLFPEFTGKDVASRALSQGIHWIKQNTDNRLLIGNVWEGNTRCLAAAKKNGFEEMGRLPGIYLKNGQYDAVIIIGRQV